MKKVTALILATTIVGTALMGCGKSAKVEETQAPSKENGSAVEVGSAEWPAIGTKDTPVSVNVMVKDVFPDEEDVMLLRDAIVEKMAAHGQYIDLTFSEPPAGSYQTALPIALMNGEIEADLVYLQGGDLTLSQQELLEDMTPYIERSTHVKNIMDDANKTRMENYPYLLWLAPSRIGVPLLRKDWSEKLTSYDSLIADPTPDNYYALFQEMKTAGMVEYGISADGSASRLDSVFNHAFGVTGTILKEDGTWIFSKASQAEKTKLEFYAKLYKDGLLDPEFLTNTWDVHEQKFYEGKVGVIVGTAGAVVQIYDNKVRSVNGDPAELLVLPPAKGVSQSYLSADVTKESRGIAINADSEHKDAAFAVLEFMASPEGRILDKVGIEGKHYQIENDKIVFTDKFPEWWSRFWETINNFEPENPSLDRSVFSPVATAALDSVNQYLVQDVNIIIPEEMTPKWDAMIGYYNEYSADIIRGVKPISAFDEFVEKWNAAGGSEFEAILKTELGE